MNKLKIIYTITILAFGSIQAYSQSYLFKTGMADSIYSEILNEKRSIWIIYPKSYNTESNKEYPVVYILDGEIQLRALDAVYNY